MGSILQWNCRGLMNNHPELCLLSQQYNPVAMCLQETHIADISKVSFKGYTPYHHLDNSHDRASGGSSIFIRNDVIHSPVNLNTTLQAVAAVHPTSNPVEPIIPHLTTSEFNIRVQWQFRQKQQNHIYNIRLDLAAAFRTNQIYLIIFIFLIYFYITIYVCVPHFYDLSALVRCWSSVSIRRIIYKFLNVCPFYCTAVAVSGKVERS